MFLLTFQNLIRTFVLLCLTTLHFIYYHIFFGHSRTSLIFFKKFSPIDRSLSESKGYSKFFSLWYWGEKILEPPPWLSEWRLCFAFAFVWRHPCRLLGKCLMHPASVGRTDGAGWEARAWCPPRRTYKYSTPHRSLSSADLWAFLPLGRIKSKMPPFSEVLRQISLE